MADITKMRDTNGVAHDIRDSRVQKATTSVLGMVKPDGTSIEVDNDGTIHASGGSNPFTKDGQGYICFSGAV